MTIQESKVPPEGQAGKSPARRAGKLKSKKKDKKNNSVKKKSSLKKTEKKAVKKVRKADLLEIDLEKLLEAGVHFGHQAKRWHPKMKPYIWKNREGIHVFDLVKTVECLREAMIFVREAVGKGGRIVLVGTKRQARAIIKEEARRCGAYFISERWLGGLISNWGQVKKSIEKLGEMKAKKEAGEYKKYTKKENVLIDREISRLERFFGGLAGLESIPEVIFVVDVKRETAAVKEAREKGVKVVAIVDTNSDPTGVDYVIPGNDDAVRSIKLMVSKIADAVEAGNELKQKTKNKK